MAIRHFRRTDALEEISSSSDSSDNSSDDERNDERSDELKSAYLQETKAEKTVPGTTSDTLKTLSDQDAERVGSGAVFSECPQGMKDIPAAPGAEERSDVENSDSSDQEASVSVESSESSSSDEEYVLHKPVFLARSKRPAGDVQSTNVASGGSKTALAAKIQEENERAKQVDKLASIRQASLNTNKDMLNSILALDDNDSRDPATELRLWQERQQARALRLRKAQEQKQSELEDYESAKLANAFFADDLKTEHLTQLIKNAQNSHSDVHHSKSIPTKSTAYDNKSEKRKSNFKRPSTIKSRKYNPQPLSKAETTLKAESSQSKVQDEQNEYSVI
ncbi:LAME_0G10616g1_1 [Lachancea meyersii CBS 8951]|uniref:LAME_0G10616g1_1 n=1 Tax=Lachancea meyersii CBS 8951 TaxID=1266667 RepID=A0A1G4K921_9SACH|nr:LAME_0G10616g1_1 [Lachancea meyersii CBS 8951]